MILNRGTVVLLVAVLGVCTAQRKLPRTQPVTAEVKTGVSFDCPEEFGYYPHPTDCTQYYVCVFGGALLESCTGGLMYSHELQTCDWPRNVGCDAGGEAGASTVAATAPSASTQQQHSRGRYTPPPPPPQPAAIVTNRGQPRQLHHQQQQQEIIKQQQLYEDAEETLPPAEEIESDRQQRVYRGQPSTIGQVQRDRDGIRNSNAIPTYSGRAEKIGIISFGTSQAQSPQPIQQYSMLRKHHFITSAKTKLIDLTNDLRRRRKRQVPQTQSARSRHQSPTDATSWHGRMALIARPTSNQHHPPIIIHTQNHPYSNHGNTHTHTQPHTIKFHVSSLNYQPHKQEDFQPFIPSYQQLAQQQEPFKPMLKTKPMSENFSYFNVQYAPKAHTSTTTSFPLYQSTRETIPSGNLYNFSKSNFSPGLTFNQFGNYEVFTSHTNQKETEAVTKKYESPPKEQKPALFSSTPEHVPELATNSTQVKPEFLSPPKVPILNLEEVLAKIREAHQAKINQTIITHYTTAKPIRGSNLNDEYYYYDYEDDDVKNTKNYSSQKTPSKPLKLRPQINQTLTIVNHKQTGLADDEEYYYEEYDYPETMPPKYSSRYNEKLRNITTTALPAKQFIKMTVVNYQYPITPVPTVALSTTTTSTTQRPKVNAPITKVPNKTKHYITKSSHIPEKTPKIFHEVMSTLSTTVATPTKKYTVRPRVRRPSKPSTTPAMGRLRIKTRHRQTTNNRLNDNDTRLIDNQTANRVEVTSVGPSQSSSAVTPSTRGIYNGSHYDPQYDPYYNLYEDDVELYRDVDYSQQYNNNNYRGTPTPSVKSSTPHENKQRGNSFNYNSQDLYQQTNVGDYNEDNRFNSQVDEQSYRQPARQPIRTQTQTEARRIQETTTTTTTTTTTSPRPVTSTYLSTTPLARSDANQTRAQSLPNTLPENPGHTPPSSPPLLVSTLSLSASTNLTITTNIDKRQDTPPNPVTYRPKYPLGPEQITDASFQHAVRSAVVNKPSPFQSSTTTTSTTTTDKPRISYYVTKSFKSTPFSNLEDFPTRSSGYSKRKVFHIRNTEASVVITPTTYAPPKFFLKSFLRGDNNTSRSVSTSQDQEYVLRSNGIKTIRKYINPIAINNVFASSTELYPNSSEESLETERISSVAWRGKIKFPYVRFTSEPEDHDAITYRRSTPLPTASSTTQRTTTTLRTTTTPRATTSTTTTTTTTTKPTTTTTTPKTIPTISTPPPFIRNSGAYQATEQYRHYVEPSSQYQQQRFRNTVEIPQLHHILDDDDEPQIKQVPDQPPSYKPRPVVLPQSTTLKTSTHNDSTFDSVPSTSRPLPEPTRASNVTLPSRVSRVNAAIKSMIGLGATRARPNTKCNETPSPTAKCESKQRTPAQTQTGRTRGSAHYTATNAVVSNNAEPVNRGTPPSRSRPTLKPSTSIVSKAQEFVDIYRFPPRRPDSIYPQPQPDKTAAKCRKDVCLLPDCSCGGKEIPGDLPVEEVPQMVLITFDDAVNDLNQLHYRDLFEHGRVNPNGCPISATFYVSHEWTDYSQVQNLYADGHELASHTVSHSFGEQFSQKKWTREVAGQREILSAYGGVKLEDVRGMRAPFLSVGGNKMFKMLYDSNFTYDSSMPIYENKPPSWPYTLDYKLFHDCMIPPCPTRSYPGVWEVPMVMWQDLNGGRCSMGDACSNPSEAENVFKMLMKNFDRHYTTNRAPFGLFYHAAWFTQPHHKAGFIQFLDTINQMKDVFLVTNWQAIQWVRDPTPMSRINNFQPFQCNYSDRPKRCNNPKVCNLWHKSGVRYMRTCQPCPDIYPWTGNTGIRSSRIDNDIED